MKSIVLLLSLCTCFTSCQHPIGIDMNSEDQVITPSDPHSQEGYYLYQGTFDLGAETITLGDHSGRLPQICNLTIYTDQSQLWNPNASLRQVYFRPYQYITYMGGRYPTAFFQIKDVYPNDNPDHFIYQRDFELEFITDEPCGDEFDLLVWYTGPWEDKHAFLAATLHPSLLSCWAEGTFLFTLSTNFQLGCPGD